MIIKHITQVTVDRYKEIKKFEEYMRDPMWRFTFTDNSPANMVTFERVDDIEEE